MNLTALVGIETGHGKACQNHNVGNLSASPSYEGKAWRPPWFDPNEASADPRLARLHEQMNAGKVPNAFRAYGSLEEGLRDFVRTLHVNFPEVLEASKQTDPDVFRRSLAVHYSGDYLDNSAATETIRALQKELGLVDSGGGGVVLAALFFWWRWASSRARKRRAWIR